MTVNTLTLSTSEFKNQLKNELVNNILPFWMNHMVDKENGGFYGAITNDLKVLNDESRSSILSARILWTYSTAYRRLKSKEYLEMAQWAYNYLTKVFWDKEYGGVYWSVDKKGGPVSDRKQHYAQAFAIYGLTEYYRATQDNESLIFAQNLFELLERNAIDPTHLGYFEGSNRNWKSLSNTRLSEKDLISSKSMNTLLHILESYTNLMRIWEYEPLKKQHRTLIDIFQNHIINHGTGHLRLFFDDAWNSLTETQSYGHDIEGSWLLWEAADIQCEPSLKESLRNTVLNIVNAVYQEGIDDDGSLFYEGNPDGPTDTTKAWWTQAEAMVGFYNAYQISNNENYAHVSYRVWEYIQERIIDRVHGDWFKQLNRDGTPDHSRLKASTWDCPYHQSRACFEMLDRLDN